MTEQERLRAVEDAYVDLLEEVFDDTCSKDDPCGEAPAWHAYRAAVEARSQARTKETT